MTHICVSKLTIIGSDNGLAPGWRQTIIWTNDGILLIGPLGTNFSEILIGIQTISFKKMHLKMASPKWRPFCLGLNVLTHWRLTSLLMSLICSTVLYLNNSVSIIFCHCRFRQRPVAYSIIIIIGTGVNWSFRNTPHRNFTHINNIFLPQ